jgi:hypothetical protein
MRYRLLLGGVLGWVLGTPLLAGAQAGPRADSLAVAAAVSAATTTYARLAQPESVLYNGPEYVDHTLPGTIGHQFFEGPEAQQGAVTYRDASFQDIPLRYDLALDRVVLTYPNQVARIMLVPENLTDFSLGSRHFVRVLGDSAAGAVLRTGFYELLQPGPVSLLARHTKFQRQTTEGQSLKFEFKQVDRLFARTSSTAAEIIKLKDLLALLPAHKQEVQRYARQQKLRFSAAQRAASALAALRYYYTLPQ